MKVLCTMCKSGRQLVVAVKLTLLLQSEFTRLYAWL